MVDSVMLDSAYDGRVFNTALADVPERKSGLVPGEHELAAPTGSTTHGRRFVPAYLGVQPVLHRPLYLRFAHGGR